MICSYPDRRFQLWLYEVSHGSLLIRSPKGPGVQHNVDLIFVGVTYIGVPRVLDGLRARPADEFEVLEATKCLGTMSGDGGAYVLESDGRNYLVIAVSLRVTENDADIFESPFI